MILLGLGLVSGKDAFVITAVILLAQMEVFSFVSVCVLMLLSSLCISPVPHLRDANWADEGGRCLGDFNFYYEQDRVVIACVVVFYS